MVILNRNGFKFNFHYYKFLIAKINKLVFFINLLQQHRNIYTNYVQILKIKKLKLKPLYSYKETYSGVFLFKQKLKLKFLKRCLCVLLETVPNELDEIVANLHTKENKVVKIFGANRSYNFIPKEHYFLFGNFLNSTGQSLALRISGSRFFVSYGFIAKLFRALGQFMLDTHVLEHGYTEVNVPFLVKSKSLYNTGQLPKFREEQYKADDDLWLIPTGEVPLVNLVSNTNLLESELPLKLVSKTACFRKEVGNYGKDLKGIFRQHQFEKVELVQVVHPNYSDNFLENLVKDATNVLDKLNLKYRIVLLDASDTGFTSTKTYDIEVWLPGKKKFIEVSSCSNTKTFQSCRMSTRFVNTVTGKREYVHILNGSGLALERVFIAIMETYQNEEGFLINNIPFVLKPYLNL